MLKMLKERAWILVVIITAILSCLAIGLTSAKYYSEFSLSGTAQVAKWDVKILENPTTELNFNENGDKVDSQTINYALSIESKSDVAVNYDIKLTFATKPLDNVSLTIDGISATSESATDNGYVYVFAGFNYNLNDSAKEHTLAITVDYVDGDKLIDFNKFTSKVSIEILAEQAAPTN